MVNEILIRSDTEQFAVAEGKFDIIIDTVSRNYDLNMYLALLKPYDVLAVVGHLGMVNFNTAPLVLGSQIIYSSFIAGNKEM